MSEGGHPCTLKQNFGYGYISYCKEVVGSSKNCTLLFVGFVAENGKKTSCRNVNRLNFDSRDQPNSVFEVSFLSPEGA